MNLRYFAVVQIEMEFLESGTVQSSLDIRSLRLEDGITASERTRVGFEVLVLLMLAYQIYEEFVELATQGKVMYFSSFFNLLDWSRYALSISIVAAYFTTLNHPVRTGLVLPVPDGTYVNFQELVENEKNLVNMHAMNILLTIMTIFKFLQPFPAQGIFVHTLMNAAGDLGSFLVILGLINFSYTLMGYVAIPRR